jgi:uncharacterized protein with FMN-binding domain
MAQRSSGKKVANSLVAVSSAAVLAVYAAGYERTRSAATRLEAQTGERRPAPGGAVRIDSPTVPGRSLAEALVPRPAPDQPSDETPDKTADKTKPVAALEALPETAQDVPSAPETSAGVLSTPAASAVEVKTPAAEPLLPPPAPVAASVPAASVWKDGTYTGWGSSRHGDIQASVVIEGGRIASATIAQCLTRYSCSVIEKLPPEVAQRQSPEVDYVSGATQSANAFYYAVTDALGKAKSQTAN